MLYIIADETIQRVRGKLKQWLTNHAQAQSHAALQELFSREDFEQRLMYLDQQIPEKASKGQELDAAAYPFSNTEGLHTAQPKSVVLVRPRISSPYSDLAAGQAVKPTQLARLVFKFEELPAE